MERFQAWIFFGFLVHATAQNITLRPPLQPSYLALVPKTLQPGVPTSLSVSILGKQPVTVSAQIMNEKQRFASNSTIIEGGSTGILTLPIIDGDAKVGSKYDLVVRGLVGDKLVFTNSTQLSFGPNGVSSFIQTDKRNYLPGQSVKIRVVSIYSDRKPVVSPVDILIRDPQGNIIRQWLKENTNLGVVSKEFELSKNPPLGQWTISTNVKGVSSTKDFLVTHYVLPRFEISIQAPEIIYLEDPLEGYVTAKYAYGKAVQGHMNLTFISNFFPVVGPYSEERDIDGTEKFSFDLLNFPMETHYHENYSDPRRRPYNEGEVESLTIVVQVTEYLTGLTYNKTAKVFLARSRYKISFEDFPTTLKPSLTFTGRIKISTYNDRPLSTEDQKKKLTVSVFQERNSWWTWEERNTEANTTKTTQMSPTTTPSRGLVFPVPADGIVPLKVKLMDDTQALTIDTSFVDTRESLWRFQEYISPSNSYLQIKKPLKPAKVGESIRLGIESNFQMTHVHYLVKSRGQVISAGISSADMILFPEASWSPEACIVVYCVHPNGEVVNDVIVLPVTPLLQNEVSLRFSHSMRKPSENVNLKVSVEEKGSLVGLLVVDQATHWGGPQNDITKETVLKHLKSFDHYMTDGSNYMMQGYPHSVFESCNLAVMTDAILNQVYWYYQEIYDKIEFNDQNQERQYFPETWIWMDVHTGESDTLDIPLIVPDSITSWTATAFVMSAHLGLGIVEEPASLVVFQDFFLSLNLPAFVIRGEELVLEVILFNYLSEGQEVTVSVKESESFQFIFQESQTLSPNLRKVYVASESGANVLIPIRPLVLGEIPIVVNAKSSAAYDSVRTTVLVKAEGLEQTFSSSLFLELFPKMRLSKNIAFTFPPDVVEGSERASIAAIGDVLGPSIQGLDSLIQRPSGCGEQNMIHFAPNIYVLQYLKLTGQDEPQTTQRAIDYMLSGYERELSFQRADGSFSAFGQSDISGSTWLSAFVLRCFLQARRFIAIDSNVLNRVTSWISAQQGIDGRFEEPGRVIHTELQGGLDGPVSLTAYVLIALLEDNGLRNLYTAQVSSALTYLETRLTQGISSNYSLSLLTYALALAGSPNSGNALDELMSRATMDADGVPMWSSPNVGLSASWQPRSADIEMMSYVLLSLYTLNRFQEGIPLMKWLSQQRNSMGGYGSTQDTVVALQALSIFAALGGSHSPLLTIWVSSNNLSRIATFHIDQNNYLVHQTQEIEAKQELNLQVVAEGEGIALVQLNVFYNVKNKEMMRRRRDVDQDEAFHLYVELLDHDMNHATLHICYSLSMGLGLDSTGMSIMEVGLLSGFSLHESGLPTDDVVKKVEVEPGKVILYLDSVTTNQICLFIPLVMEFKVARVQEAVVVIYDYYEPRRMTARMYTSVWRNDMSSCSFCGEDCSQCQANDFEDDTVFSRGSRPLVLMCIFPSFLLLFFIFVM